MLYLLSWSSVDEGMRYPTTKYIEYTEIPAALAAAAVLIKDGYAVHLEPIQG